MSSIPNLVTCLQQTAQRYADNAAIISAGKTVTFSDFNELSDRMAAALLEHGIKKGDRVAIYSINSDMFAIAYFGIIKAGAVAVPINLLLPASEILYILQDAGVSGLIYHPMFSDNVSALRPDLKDLTCEFIIGESSNSGILSTDDILAQSAKPPAVEFDPKQDVVSIIYTSGTTGHPKGAMLTHQNLIANTTSTFKAIQVEPGRDILFVVLPMFHSFAHTVGMILPLLHGCSFVPFPKFDVQLVADAIEQTGATVFMGVPAMYGALLTLAEGEEQKLKTLRYCISGAAAMPLSIMEKFEARFAKAIYEGDGPTECSPVTCVNPIDGKRKPGSVGVPIPDVEMAIRDADGKVVPDNEIGEIVVRGENIMKGYWQHPKETAESFFDDWYRTGDLGYQDDDGYFYIVDRLKDMLIVNGENVYPKMVEDVLHQCPGIKEAAVIGQADELRGEVPIAYVSKDQASELSEQDVVDFCKDKLAKFQLPRTVYFMESLPKTPTGKILKRELRQP